MKNYKWPFLSLAVMCMPIWASASNSCTDAFEVAEANDRQIIFSNSTQTRYYTYSHDSEIPADEVFKLIFKHGKPEEVLKHLVGYDKTGLFNLLNAELKKKSRKAVTYSFFEKMVLRKNRAEQNDSFYADKYTILSLNAQYLGYLFEGVGGWSKKGFCIEPNCVGFRQSIINQLNAIFQTLELSGEIGFDGDAYGRAGAVEIRTVDFESDYSHYWRSMKKFKATFPRAATHFHLGLPIHIPLARAKAIARWIETVSLFKVIENTGGYFYEEGHGENIESSSLYYKSTQHTEGPYVRLNRPRFMDPFEAHNLEIKGLMDTNLVKRLMDLSMTAGQSRQELLTESWPGSLSRYRDLRFGNILGALEYLKAFEVQINPNSEIAVELMELTGKFQDHFFGFLRTTGYYPTELLVELRGFIIKHKLIERMTSDTYLTTGATASKLQIRKSE